MFRQGANVAMAFFPPLRSTSFILSIVIGRFWRSGKRFDIREVEGQLLGANDGALFRARAEDHVLERAHRRTQSFDLGV